MMDKKQRGEEIQRDIVFLRGKLAPLNTVRRPPSLSGGILFAHAEAAAPRGGRARWLRPLAGAAAVAVFAVGAMLTASRTSPLDEGRALSSSAAQAGAPAMESATAAEDQAVPRAAGFSGNSSLTGLPRWEEEGADILKIESGTIYYIAAANGVRKKTTLYLVDTGALRELSRVELTAGFTGLLHTSGDRIAVLLEQNNVLSPAPDGALTPCTTARIYNVADRSAPLLENEFTQEGAYADSRLADGVLYLATRAYGGTTARDVAGGQPPRVLDSGGERALPPGDMLSPGDAAGGYAVASAITLGDGSHTTRAVRGGEGSIYFSDNSLYTAAPAENGQSAALVRFPLGGGLEAAATGKVLGALGDAIDVSGGSLYAATDAPPDGLRLTTLDGGSLAELSRTDVPRPPMGSSVTARYIGGTAYLSGADGLGLAVRPGAVEPFSGTLPDLLVPAGSGLLGLRQEPSGKLRLSLLDPASPLTETAGMDIGREGSFSPAFYDPSAFLYDAGTGIAGLPVEGEDYCAFQLFRVGGGTLEAAGEVSHAQGGAFDYRTDTIRRGAVADETLFTAGDGMITATALDTLEQKAALALT